MESGTSDVGALVGAGPLAQIANRPFSVVFAAVVTFVCGLSWLVLSGVVVSLAATAGVGGALANIASSLVISGSLSDQAVAAQALLSIAFAILNVMGVLAVVASFGVWSLAQWGRRLTAAVQLFAAFLGLVLICAATSSYAREAGLSGILAFLGLIAIAYAISVVILLLRRVSDPVFRRQ